MAHPPTQADAVSADSAPSRVRRAILAHLGSEHVAHVIYGAIIGLALVQALKGHPPAPAVVAGLLFGSAVAVGLAEAYSEIIAAEARTRRRVHGQRMLEVVRGAAAVVLGAGFPAVFFLLAAAGAWGTQTAFRLATWTGLTLIVAYGYLGARLSGSRVPAALLRAAAVGVIGGILIGLKALLH